jgi:molybdopterin biosynthesis enzyme
VPKHYSVDAAIGWVDAVAHSLDTVEAPLGTARGRVLAERIGALRPIPSSDRAALDGFAVLAKASLGASAYNPVQLPLIAVAAGDALPAGADAVVPLELAEPDSEARIEVVEAVAAGDNVEQQGAIATVGATLVPAGTRLAARHIGLLTIAGLSEIPVVRRPGVRLLVAKPAKASAWRTATGR